MERKKLRLKLTGDKHFQWNTILFFLSVVLFTGLLVMLTNTLVVMKSPVFHELLELNGWVLVNKLIVYSSITIILCVVMALMFALIYSNKVAGPMYRLKAYLHDMINGNMQKPLRFRSDDEFKDLTYAVNSFRKKLMGAQKVSEE